MKFVNLEDVIERLQYWSGGFDYIEVPTDYAVEQMESLPMFELVRCKECKHYHANIPCVGGEYDGCDAWLDNGNEIEVNPDDFCNYGKRREG